MSTPAVAMPSIRISRSGLGGLQEPVTPINSDVETTPASPATDEPPSSSVRKDSLKASSNRSLRLSTRTTTTTPPSLRNGDPAKLPRSAMRVGRRPTTIQREGSSPVDPITLSIQRRTGTGDSFSRSLGNDDPEKLGTHVGAPGLGGVNTKGGLGKKKAVSFLSRFMGNKKKMQNGEEEASEAIEDGELRAEGMNAAVFSQPIGFTPTFPAPPKYIRVHAHHKPQREFNQLFLAQELHASPVVSTDAEEGKVPIATASDSTLSLILKNKSGAIWAMKFSRDGRYLAAAGTDKVVRVWQVLGSKEDRATHEQREDSASTNGVDRGGSGVRLNAPVFMSEPIHVYQGHTGDVLDLSWSKNNFLLSSSMDKTVRLWHVTRKECLCCFQHSDFVTSIAFHPRDDRFFLAGSLDSKLRLWSIPDKSVAFWNELPDLITAVAFTPDGRMAIAGCLNGLCLFYETEGLRYHTQLHVRSTHGRNAKGSKITGIETLRFPPDDPNGEVKILVTSNDSRVRMYNARDKALETKFKGYQNTCSQIHATFSDDTKYIISGSEDRKVYIWNVEPGDLDKKDKRPVEFFEAHSAMVTVALIAPVSTRQALGQSGDPLYDLCNPPPVTLVSRSDSIASSKKTGLLSNDLAPTSTTTSFNEALRPAPTNSWKEKCTHPDGNIIVTADYNGNIKIFRQDCAVVKRKQSEAWDTASTLSKKILRRSSINQAPPDRIKNWRQSITSINSIDTGSSIHSITSTAASRRQRSSSPAQTSAPSNGSMFSRNMGTLRNRVHSMQHINGGVPGEPSVGEHLDVAKEVARRTSAATIDARMARAAAGFEDEEEEDGLFSSDAESDEEAVRCRCGSTNFKAKHSRRGEHKLVCVKCNTVMV